MSEATGTDAVSARRARRLLRRFDRFLQRNDIFIQRYGEDEAAVMRREMGEEYSRLIPQVPYLGSRR